MNVSTEPCAPKFDVTGRLAVKFFAHNGAGRQIVAIDRKSPNVDIDDVQFMNVLFGHPDFPGTYQFSHIDEYLDADIYQKV